MPMPGPPDLTDLLGALRAEGIPVGPRELTRLHLAFAAAPVLDREALRAFLACLLAKNPAERDLFDRHFNAWCPDLAAHWGPEAQPPPTPPDPKSGQPEPVPPVPDPEPFERLEPPGPQPRWPQAMGFLAVLALTGGLIYLALQPPVPLIEPQKTEHAVQVPTPPEQAGLPANPSPRVWYWQARIQSVAIPDRLAAEELALIGALAGLLALGLWWRFRWRHPEPETLPRTEGGPAWLPLPPVTGSDTSLMGSRERRALVWNVGRFAGEDLTRRLDEPATAAATARAGGLAEPRYRHARFPREVWLWCDEHCPDPALTALAGEIAISLTRSGLSVRRGSFAGTPTQVWWRGDDRFEPSRMEGHRQHALVALLTDGLGLARDLDSPLRARHTAVLLRQLRLWPHLALVDFGPPGRLARRVRPFGLKVLAPSALPAWLAGGDARSESGPGSGPAVAQGGDLRLWAAACCLGADPPDAAAAQRLRQRLGLSLNPWAIRDLIQDAGDPSLRWPEARRRALVSWLLRAGPLTDGDVPAQQAPAAQTIAWWRARYAEAARRQGRRESRLLPWERTGARRRWALEDGLLALCLDPEGAVPRLRALALADPQLRDEVRARLAGVRAADQPGATAGEGAVVLTWSLGRLPDRAQEALAWLGLGGLRPLGPRPGLPPPPRLVLTLGLLGGLACAALGAAAWRWTHAPETELISADPSHDHPAIEAQTIRVLDQGQGRVLVGSARHTDGAEVRRGTRVQVAWSWGLGEADNNPVRLRQGSKALVYRAGTLPQPVRPCVAGWPARALAVIAADPQAEPARRLAIRLLDSGTADQVLISPDWAGDLGDFVGADPLLNANTRLLVVLGTTAPPAGGTPALPGPVLQGGPAAWALVAADPEALADWLDFPGVRPLPEAPARVLASQGDLPWHGGPEQVPDPATGITWVHICPGTFTMGSDLATDPMSQENERPAHPVALGGFWMAKTETTKAQYRRLVPGHAPGTDGNLPAADITWQQARTFCDKQAGGDLPTEAQWEHAARGGSLTPWSFRLDEARLGDHAWYKDNSGGEAHPVGQKAANPLGLHDLHGNLYEWVLDWYGPYADGFGADPGGAGSGEYRVLRGGSFVLSPEDLRSALRGGVPPGVRRQVFGFRCVRVAPPQP